jgi:hypothetical protein
MADHYPQPVTGVVPPLLAEARIRDVWPSVARFPALAGIGRALTATIILAPLAWLLMSAAYFGKLLPLIARRYTLTNRRVTTRAGWAGTVTGEVPLAEIEDVRVVPDSNTPFFRAADLQIIRNGQVALTLPGVPDPETFRQMILNARNAWAPETAKRLPFIPASAVK